MKYTNELKVLLSNFTGCEQPFRHSLIKSFLYTDGVQAFAKNAGHGAYWLLDILATEPAISNQSKEFSFVKLNVYDSKADLTVTDGNDTTVFTKHINYTDCPKGEWLFYIEPADSVHTKMMLPQER